jgi:hypothetical protein
MRKGSVKRSASDRSPIEEQEARVKINPVAKLLNTAAYKVKESMKAKEDSSKKKAQHTPQIERERPLPLAVGHFTFDEGEENETTPQYKDIREKELSCKSHVEESELISPYDTSGERHKKKRNGKLTKKKTAHKGKTVNKKGSTSLQPHNKTTGAIDPTRTVDQEGDSVASGPSASQLEESEDDLNTVGSGNTTVRNKKTESKPVLPPFVRYQLMIMLGEENDIGSTGEEDDNEEKSPTEIVREYLIKFYKEMKRCDDKSEIVSYIMSPNFTYLPADKFPKDVVEMAKYFKGYRKNIKPGKRVYITLAIHTPENPLDLERQLETWVQLHSFTFRRTIIQSESATCIGWLAYSSYYTDTEAIKSYLSEHSNFEWGFRIQAVTKSDSTKKWNERIRAMAVYVPTSKTQVAISLISLCMEAEKDANERQLHLFDKYCFVRPEYAMKSRHNSIIFKSMLRRHEVHTRCLRAQLCSNIICDVDQQMIDAFGNSRSLRDIILDIRVYDKKSPLFNTSLFHSIDYVEDTSKLWIDGAEGPGGAAHVFTFYETVQMEAEEFIMGLGRYIARTRGKRMALAMFDSDHFDASSQWKWDVDKSCFVTPIKKLAYANLRYDNNLPAIKALELLDLQCQQEEKAEADRVKAMLANLSFQSQSNRNTTNTQNTTRTIQYPSSNPNEASSNDGADSHTSKNEENKARGDNYKVTGDQRDSNGTKQRDTGGRIQSNSRNNSQPTATASRHQPINVDNAYDTKDETGTLDEQLLTDAFQKKDEMMLLKILQPDLDSLDGMDEAEKKKLKNVYIHHDDRSQTSSITANTNGSLAAESVNSRSSLQSVNTSSDSIRSLLTVNKDTIKSLMKPGMSKEELELRVEAYFAVQMQKAKDKKECAKETYVKELMSEFSAQEEESSTESSKEKTEKEKSTRG